MMIKKKEEKEEQIQKKRTKEELIQKRRKEDEERNEKKQLMEKKKQLRTRRRRRQTRLNLATWNVRGLAASTNAGKARLIDLQRSLDNVNVDVVALTELKMIDDQPTSIDLADSTFRLYYGPRKTTDHAGAGFLVGPTLQPHVEDYAQPLDTPRVARLHVKIGRRRLAIYSLYAPASTNRRFDLDDYQKFVDELKAAVKSDNIPLRNVIIAGDANARVGSRQPADRSIGPHGCGQRNERGEIFAKLCEELKLDIRNTFTSSRECRRWTWRSPTGDTSMIDYICAPRAMKKGCGPCWVLNAVSTKFNSDHRLVRLTIRINHKPASYKKKLPRMTVKTDNDQLKLNIELYLGSARPRGETAIDFYTKFVDRCKKAQKESTTYVPMHPRFSPQTLALLRERRALKATARTRNDWKNVTEANKAARKSMEEDLTRRQCEMIVEALKKGRSFKPVKKEKMMGKRRMLMLKKTNGDRTKNEVELRTEVQKFYAELYASQKTVPNSTPLEIALDKSPPITTREVESTLARIPKRKAPGTDGLAVGTLRAGGLNTVNYLKDLYNECIDMNNTPKELVTGKTVLLFKKGDSMNLANYRPITLLPICYKTLTHVINKRMEKVLDENQSKKQTGFKKGSGTIDNIFCMNILLEKYNGNNEPIDLYCAFVDYQKAFDTVEWEAVWSALRRRGIDEDLVLMLKKIYQLAINKVDVNGREVDVTIERGVRQGDPISPKLFTAVLDDVMSRLEWQTKGVNVEGKWLPYIAYADDIAVLATSRNELEKMLDELDEEASKSGLIISRKKTCWLTTEKDCTDEIKIKGVKIEKVTEFNYLGSMLAANGSTEPEVDRRIRLGWAAFYADNELYKNGAIPMEMRRKLYNCKVLPALAYGLEARTLTLEQMKKLRTAQNEMGRRMMRITLFHQVRIDEIRETTGIRDVIEERRKRMKSMVKKLNNQTMDSWSKRMMNWQPTVERKPGRPKTTWINSLTRSIWHPPLLPFPLSSVINRHPLTLN